MLVNYIADIVMELELLQFAEVKRIKKKFRYSSRNLYFYLINL